MKLTQKIMLYVPATIGNEKVDNKEQVGHVATELCKMFGGATALPPVRGFWADTETGELIEEPTVQVYAMATLFQRLTFRQKIRELAKWIKSEMKQQSVALEINGSMEFL